MTISQEDAARLMFAHANVVAAQKRVLTSFRLQLSEKSQQLQAAEKAFADLVATLVEGENA